MGSRHLPIRSGGGVLALGLAVGACATAPAPIEIHTPARPPVAVAADTIVEQGTLMMIAQGDTIAVEHFTRVGRTTSSSLTVRDDVTVDYHMSVDRRSGVRQLDVRITHDGDTEPRQRFMAQIGRDSIHSQTMMGDTIIRAAAVLPEGTLPYLHPSPVLLESLVRNARGTGRSDNSVPVLFLGTPSAVYNVQVTFVGDSAYVQLAGTTTHLLVDLVGRILGGAIPAQGVTIVRASSGGE